MCSALYHQNKTQSFRIAKNNIQEPCSTTPCPSQRPGKATSLRDGPGHQMNSLSQKERKTAALQGGCTARRNPKQVLGGKFFASQQLQTSNSFITQIYQSKHALAMTPFVRERLSSTLPIGPGALKGRLHRHLCSHGTNTEAIHLYNTLY